jgi:DNA-binding response OmpR family regulator
VEVRDTGRGISAQDQELLFQKFAQLEADTKVKGGTGLGLAICKALIAEHGGTIGVDSSEGDGATFWFELRALSVEGYGSPGAADGERRVLIVEDDPDIARLLTILLKDEGLESDVAGSVSAARDAMAARIPDAVILDLRLPDGHGVEVMAVLRALSGGRDVPIIVVSASESRQESYGNVFLIDWIEKPIDERRLRSALRHAFRSHGPPKALIFERPAESGSTTSEHLRALGVESVAAQTTEHALRLAESEHPDIIIVDTAIPRKESYRLVDQLRHTGSRKTPLVVYAGEPLTQANRGALTLGTTRYVTRKPNDAEELHFKTAVRELLAGIFTGKPC